MAQFINIVVDRGIFFDIGVRGRYVGFWLIVIVVTDKILHGIVGKKLSKFAVELSCKGLIGS